MAGTDDIIGGWIKDAEKTGELKRLPGYGKPLKLDDDAHIPPQYRMPYRVLKNAGITPPEVEMIKEVAALKQMMEEQTDEDERAKLRAKLVEAQNKLDVALDKFRSRG